MSEYCWLGASTPEDAAGRDYIPSDTICCALPPKITGDTAVVRKGESFLYCVAVTTHLSGRKSIRLGGPEEKEDTPYVGPLGAVVV
jgi:hypothetical protein